MESLLLSSWDFPSASEDSVSVALTQKYPEMSKINGKILFSFIPEAKVNVFMANYWDVDGASRKKSRMD